jgi:hypothetical protein
MKILLQCLLLLQIATPSQTGGTLSGTLRTADGAPLADIRVTTVAVDAGALSVSELRTTLTRTDSSGHFLLQGVPPGRYYIAAGLISYPIYYPGSASLKDAREIDVQAGAVIENINFSVDHPRGFRVSGRLVDDSGVPVKSVVSSVSLNFPELLGRLSKPVGNTPRVTLLADPWSTPYTAAVDNNGVFELDGTPPGNYRLWVNGAAGMFPKDIVIGDADIAGVTLVIPKIIRIDVHIEFDSNASHSLPGIQFTSVQTTNDFMKMPDGGVIPSLMSAQNGITLAVATGTYAYMALARIDSNGTFQVSLPSGQYNLKLVSSPGLSIRSIALGKNPASPSSLKLDSDGTLDIAVSETTPEVRR